MSEQGGLTGCATPQHGEKNKREAVRKEKGIKMTAKELNLAARTVFAEAATEGLDGQMAVAQTMYDQLYHNIIGADGSGFGKTLEEVIQNAYTTPTDQDIRGSSCLEAVIRVFLYVRQRKQLLAKLLGFPLYEHGKVKESYFLGSGNSR